MSECLICEHPVTDADVCSGCARTCDVALGEVRWLLHELDLAITRQTARSEHVGGVSASTPLPFAWDPSDLRWALENTISTWARVVADERPADLPEGRARRGDGIGPYCQVCEHESCRALWRWEPVDTGLLAAWMTGHVEWLRHHPAGHEAIDEITAVVRRCKRAIDVRPARIYAGPCATPDPEGSPCGHDLYADPMSAVVTCPACGERYDVAERKAWLIEAARDHLATAMEASRLCWTMLGDLVTTAMIRGYERRGRLASHASRSENGREVKLYRIGDVIDAAQAARWDEREQRATRRAGAA